MENAYGIGVKNRYELFYDDNVDPLELLRQKEEEKERRKIEKSNPKDKSKTTKTNSATPLSKKTKDTPSVNSSKPLETTETSNKTRSRPFVDRNARNTRSFDESKEMEERKNFRNREEHGPTSENSARKKESDSTWMGDEFDASGGKQNDSWNGSLEVNNPGKEATGEKSGDNLTEHVESKENLPVSEERPEQSVREMTLDEWKREQEAKRAIPKYNLRKPGEGEDKNKWKKLYVLKKKVRDEEEEEEEDDDTDEDECAPRRRQRQLLDIQINFNDSRRGRGRGRGSRGIGPRNERGSTGGKDIHRDDRREPVSALAVGGRSYRGSMRSNKPSQQSAPRVDDWNDFPSLVTA
ncbi:HABP4_PAI-RBP1 domain-containing protein [Trichonephila inaurata madagascariensis]|uniref:HABP4_PAI-RBP1 domain-containing protein n=1 Tax=Trichonephila inaurata madagascariensis TaxID=2747483 RepID=A0A8X7C837_9ARAC|nr:HABP4_PAI-RBP1 domain-containing protein [Trichonephila inaurata madagascariensis]